MRSCSWLISRHDVGAVRLMVTVRLFLSVEDVACAVFSVFECVMMVGFITGALSVELEIFLVVLAVEDAHQAAIDGLFERGRCR